jgi:ABC-type nitrate/sulfonate/bicarbonate transport system ATPase subunit
MKTDYEQHPPTPHSPLPTPYFYCEGVTRNYETVPVVEGISIGLPRGGFISLVGPSGIGKTTLFNVLAGLDRPDAGKVFFDGSDITGTPGRVGYMPQKDLLLEHRTVLDNVILPPLIRGEKKKTAREHAATFFPRFGLTGYEKKYPAQLSGGMRQRAALLRTYLTRNTVILLDEPFSGLDAITRSEMQDWYREIAESLGLSTLFITHDIEEALLLSGTVHILNGKPGKIIRTIEVPSSRPRDLYFSVSPEFAELKRMILMAIQFSG